MRFSDPITVNELVAKLEALRAENEALRAKRDLYKTKYRELIAILLGLSAKSQ